MTLILELTPEQEARLRENARARGMEENALLQELIAGLPPLNKPMTGADLVAALERDGVFGPYGDPDLDSLEMARRLRQEAEKRGGV